MCTKTQRLHVHLILSKSFTAPLKPSKPHLHVKKVCSLKSIKFEDGLKLLWPFIYKNFISGKIHAFLWTHLDPERTPCAYVSHVYWCSHDVMHTHTYTHSQTRRLTNTVSLDQYE